MHLLHCTALLTVLLLQVDEVVAAAEMPLPAPPKPVSADLFHALCAAPPLQVRVGVILI